MNEGIRLQNRDIELLIFLGRYKIISLDNTRYIYGTITYQEKRIVTLAKYNYVRRLKHRKIALGLKGKEFLIENGYEIRRSMYLQLNERYKAEKTDFRFADLQLDENNFIVLMPIIDMEVLAKLHYYYKENKTSKEIHIMGQVENESVIKKYLPKCHYWGLTMERIKELVEDFEKMEDEDDEEDEDENDGDDDDIALNEQEDI